MSSICKYLLCLRYDVEIYKVVLQCPVRVITCEAEYLYPMEPAGWRAETEYQAPPHLPHGQADTELPMGHINFSRPKAFLETLRRPTGVQPIEHSNRGNLGKSRSTPLESGGFEAEMERGLAGAPFNMRSR
jgi:hypothetical protein